MHEASLSVRPLEAHEIDAVSALARVVWQATYPTLISQAQIDAMLGDRYAPARLRAQCDDPAHGWWVAHYDPLQVGFAHAILSGADCKLDKLYVHPDMQRQGIGKALLGVIASWARQHQALRIRLQVNRGNTQAIAAYQRYGFHIVASQVFDIGGGYIMDDHIMELSL